MFEELEENQPKEKKPTNYTGVIIGAVMLPVFLLFRHFGRVDLALPACTYMGMILFAIVLRWKLRTKFWFWAVILVALALHVYLLVNFSWPQFRVTRISLLPIGLADLLIILGMIQLVGKFIVRDSAIDDD